jgi:hypothetical protein
VVACTAGAEKMGDDERGSSDEVAEDDGDGGGGEGDDDGGDDDGIDDGGDDEGFSAADAADIVSIKCFIGHMIDDQSGFEYDQDNGGSEWRDIVWDYNSNGTSGWDQGPENSDAKKAYDDCF